MKAEQFAAQLRDARRTMNEDPSVVRMNLILAMGFVAGAGMPYALAALERTARMAFPGETFPTLDLEGE